MGDADGLVEPLGPMDAICTTCGGVVHWIDCPTGGWWAHDRHPADDHDARPQSTT